MVDEEIDVREVLRRLDQVARMVVVGDRTQRQSLVDAEAPHSELPRFLEHRVGDLLVVDEPAVLESLGAGPGVRLPGVDLQRFRLQLHEVEIGLAELRASPGHARAFGATA